jgi:hypothetical protein
VIIKHLDLHINPDYQSFIQKLDGSPDKEAEDAIMNTEINPKE